jgi:hypothetical protein
MKDYKTIKVRFWGAEGDPGREIIVEGPLDGSLFWFDTLEAIYPKNEILSYGISKYLVD